MEHAALRAAVSRSYRRWVKVCIWTLSVTGAYMIVDRFTNARLGPGYVGLVTAKVGLAIVMFYLALVLSDRAERQSLQRIGRVRTAADDAVPAGRPHRPWPRLVLPLPSLILIVGIVVYVLGAALNVISR